MPRITRIAVLSLPPPGYANFREVFEDAARTLGLRLQRADASDPGELDGAFAAMVRNAAAALLVLNNPVFSRFPSRIAELAIHYRLPTISELPGFAKAGGLLEYGADVRASFRRGVVFVDKILKGARAADIPVEEPTHYELRVNLRTAKALGLVLPLPILARADEVIE